MRNGKFEEHIKGWGKHINIYIFQLRQFAFNPITSLSYRTCISSNGGLLARDGKPDEGGGEQSAWSATVMTGHISRTTDSIRRRQRA